MDLKSRSLIWIGAGLIGLSVVLLILSFLPGWGRAADPAIAFLSLSAVLIFFLFASPPQWQWKGWLFIPAAGLLTLGIIFLFNAITGDWNSWAYAWLLAVGGLGIGLALSARSFGQNRLLFNIGVWTAASGAALFGIFGAIASGPFIRIVSILLLGAVGALVVLGARKKVNWLDWDSFVRPTPPGAAQSVINPAANQAQVEPLSTRELEVLRWIDQGLTNAEIAGRMVVAHSTVKTHINNIYTKLGAQSRTQAIRRARELGLL